MVLMEPRVKTPRMLATEVRVNEGPLETLIPRLFNEGMELKAIAKHLEISRQALDFYCLRLRVQIVRVHIPPGHGIFVRKVNGDVKQI